MNLTWWHPPKSRERERNIAVTTAVFYLALGIAIHRANSVSLGSLNFPHVWPFLFVGSGLLALTQAWLHSAVSWSVVTALVSVTAAGRGVDLLINLNQFTARAVISTVFHFGTAATMWVAWTYIGATTDASDG